MRSDALRVGGRRYTVRLFTVVLVMVALAGCGSHGSSAATQAANENFINQVQSNAPDINQYRSNTQLTRLGHAVCDDFRSGVDYETLADRISLLAPTLPAGDLGAVIDAAVAAYCPQYSNQTT